MRLTSWEEERLLVFTAAELARRHRAAGLPLNAPEAIAVICDAMFEAARTGADYAAIETAGRTAVRLDDVMPGVRSLVDEVRLEVLVGDGTRLIVLLDPLASPAIDTDHDGIPNTWETAHGLNPSDASDGNKTNLSKVGYTNLEMYLNELAGDFK